MISTGATLPFPMNMLFVLWCSTGSGLLNKFVNCIFLSLIFGTGITFSRNDFTSFPCTNARYLNLYYFHFLYRRVFPAFLNFRQTF